jgi:hypothetical protein
LYVTDYTGVRIHLSCMLLTTLEYGYICLVWYWLHWKTNVSLLQCSQEQNKTNVSYSSVVRNRTRQMCPYFSAVIYRTRQMYPYSSVVRNSTRQMYPSSSVVSNLQDKCIRYWLHWSMDTFVLYVTDYTGKRIYLSCMLLTTLEYGYICLVCYWLHWSGQMCPYSSVVRNRTRQLYRAPV